MVRSLTTGLTNAVNAKARKPYITATIEDHINHLGSSVSASNSDGYNDCCIASDGSIIRVRLTRGGSAFAQSFQYQRITNPLTGSQWTTWTTFTGGSANMFQDGGCAVSNNSGTLRAFAQRGTGGNDIYTWSSSDNGATWSGAATSVLVPPASALTKGIASAGNSDVFFLYDVTGGEKIGASFFSAGAWSALTAWTLGTISDGAGLAAYWTGSLYYIQYSNRYALKQCTSNSNATTWVALQDIAQADNTALERRSPRIAFFDSTYNLICIEEDSGFLTGAVYSYARLRQSKDLIHWSNGRIFKDVTATYGVEFIKNTHPGGTRARYILVAMTTIQYNDAYSQSDTNNYVDVSTKITEYKRVDQLDRPAELEIVLDNNANGLLSSFSDYGSSYKPIGLNNSVILNEGYLTGTPPTSQETVKVGTYHIKKMVFERRPGINQIRLLCRDLSYLLDLENRYQVIWASQTVSWLITEVCARAGLLDISVPGTSQMSVTVPTFTLHAGQRYRQALETLCRIGWLEYFLDQTETMIFKELSGADASVWSYTPEMETLALGTDDIAGNHIIVTGQRNPGGALGNITTGEAYDTTHAHVVGMERVIMSHDHKLTTAGLCEDSADFILQQEQRDQYAHSIDVPCNPALQLLDPITTTDQSNPLGTGISNTSRIIKQSVHFLPEKAIYDMHIELEGV